MSNTKNSFVFNLAWYEVLKDYPAEVRLEVYEAAIRYAASGTLSKLKPLSSMAFSFIKKEIDYNNERWEETVSKRSKAGMAGAEKRWQTVANDSKNGKCHKSHDANSKNGKGISEIAKMAKIAVNVNDNVNKEILSNESTKKDEVDKSPSSTPSHYLNFMQWMETNAPNVYSGCGRSFTEDEYTKIRAVTSKERLVDCVLAIENRKDLLKKYRSLYLTLRNWIKRDEKA